MGTQSTVIKFVTQREGKEAVNGLTNDFKTLIGVMGAVGTATIAVKKVLEFSKEAAAIQRMQTAGSKLAASYGASMDEIVSKVQKASHYTVSELDVIAAANRAMMLNVSADADEMAQLMEVAINRGRAMGLSASDAFNDIVTGIGRMSPMILDNLGIIINAESLYKDYAEANGIAADEIDNVTKRQILLNGVLEDGQKQIAEMGGLVDDSATGWEQMSAAVKDYTDFMKVEFLGSTGEIIGALADELRYLLDISKAANEGGDALAQLSKAQAKGALGGRRLAETHREEAETIRGIMQEVNKLAPAIGALTDEETELSEVATITWNTQEVAFEAAKISVNNYRTAIEGARLSFAQMLEESDTGLSDTIAGMIESIKWISGGGGELQELSKVIWSALEEGKITPEQATEFLEPLIIAAESLEIDLGKETKWEGIKDLAEKLEIPLHDAGILLQEFTDEDVAALKNRLLEMLDPEPISNYAKDIEVIEERWNAADTVVRTVGDNTKSMFDTTMVRTVMADQKIEALHHEIDALPTDREINIDVNINYNYSGAPPGGGTGFGTGSGAGGFSTWCFVAGTPITMAGGGKLGIENIHVGDRVLSYDVEKGEFIPCYVEHVMEPRLANDIYQVSLENGVIIRVTGEHPFMVSRAPIGTPLEHERFVIAKNLREDMEIFAVHKDSVYTVKVRQSRLVPTMAKVYNFTVADTHTYIADGCIVHNKMYAAQAGADFIVPPGYGEPYNPFMLGVSAGERVTVTPASGAGQGGGNGGEYNTYNFYAGDETSIAIAMQELTRLKTKRYNTYMGA